MQTLTSKLNVVSEKLMKEAGAELTRFDNKKFETLGRIYDEPKKRFVMAVAQNIPSKCRIFDPWAKKEGGKWVGEYIDIAYDTGQKSDGTAILGEIILYRVNSGEIDLSGKKPEDVSLYRYLKLCNWNDDNKGKKWHIQPMKYIFKENNVAKKAEASVSVDIAEAKAISAIADMSSAELTEYCRGLGRAVHSNADIMRESLIKFAKISIDNAKKVVNLKHDNETKFISDIALAEELKVIVFSGSSWRWGDGDEAFHTVTTGREEKQSLCAYFLSPEGERVYAQMIELISEKEVASEIEAENN